MQKHSRDPEVVTDQVRKIIVGQVCGVINTYQNIVIFMSALFISFMKFKKKNAHI